MDKTFQFIDIKNCNLLIQQNEYVWKKIIGPSTFFQTKFKDALIEEILSKKFFDIKGIKVEKMTMRLFKFSKGSKLQTHTFNYKNFENQIAKNINSCFSWSKELEKTQFVLFIFLGENFTGGEYLFNGEKVFFSHGYGVIHDTTSFGKLYPIKSGNAYYLVCNILQTLKNKIF